ncbi:MAG TPA: hypothetical protein VMN36_18045 [Verrucomicrobiales bacterium]|nr:hypothetical protein [Verrucomicrobiales bacterium]
MGKETESMTVNDHLSELGRDLEVDLREAQRLLELSWEDAVGEMRSRRATLGEEAQRAVRSLEPLANEADSRMQEVQDRLGELNLLLAEEEIGDMETFLKYRERVLGAMEAARDALARLEAEGRAGWSERGEVMREVWRRFFGSLELVRIHLARDGQMASERFEQERVQLIEDLGRIRETPHKTWTGQDLKTALTERYQAFVPYLRALLVWPDEVAPKPPGQKRED